MTPAYSVAELVPHSGTLSLMTRIIDFGEKWLRAEIDITARSLFATEQGVPASIGIEYMAQTVSAYAGTRGKEKGEGPKLGFLLGTRKYQCNQPWFPPGSTLCVEVRELLQGENGLGVFECTITSGDLLASASLNVFQPDDFNDVLSQATPT